MNLVIEDIHWDLGITSLFGSSCMYSPQNHMFASGAAGNLLGFVLYFLILGTLIPSVQPPEDRREE